MPWFAAIDISVTAQYQQLLSGLVAVGHSGWQTTRLHDRGCGAIRNKRSDSDRCTQHAGQPEVHQRLPQQYASAPTRLRITSESMTGS